MATLKGSSIASTFDQLVQRATVYSQTGTNIELMDDTANAIAKPTGLYLESGATTDNVGIGVAAPASLLHIKKAATTGSVPLGMLRLEVNETSDVELTYGEGPSIDFYVAETGGSQLGGRIAQVRTSLTDTYAASRMEFHTAADGVAPTVKMTVGDDTIPKVGIGTTTPSLSSAIGLDIEDTQDGGATKGGALRLSSNPDGDATASGDRLGVVEFAGTETIHEAMIVGAKIEAVATETWDTTNNGANLNFYTTPGNDDATLRMTILSTGNVGIGGIATPTAQLHIDQSSASGAIPVLTLDQGDVSEEMMEFLCTIGTGNAIEAVGAKSLTTTHFIKVTIQGGLTRYIPVGTIA